MRSFRLAVSLLAFTVLGAAPTAAAECDAVTFPEQTSVGASTLKLNGLGLRLATMLKVKVYVAALYVQDPTRDPKAILDASTPKQLVLHFVRGVDSGELEDAWDEGFEANAKAQLAALQPRIAQLKSWMADMKTGELLTFTSTPGAGLEVNVGGKVAGTIEGDDFGRAFLSIWLGDHPPNPGLKDGLLGGSCE
jgi:hypothetical protein